MKNNTKPTQHSAIVNGVRLRYSISGSGEPLVLLHGWPQSRREWRHVIPSLASHFTVIAPDMRGFGDSDKPSSGYDKRTVAKDIHELIHQLGFEKIYLVGHDIGLMVAYEYAASHPNEVKKLVVMEAAIPGLGLEALQDTARFPHLWHFGFFIAPGVAESLVTGHEEVFLRYFIQHLAYDASAITDEDINMKTPGGLRGGFEHYRAFTVDAINNKENASTKLPMPVLGIGGSHGMGNHVGELMKPLAQNVKTIVIDRSGHWIPEEQPEQLVNVLINFLNSK
ncbi:alpha/beta fold hydrolase [Pseudomonas aeruginosa]|uniref:alpha/beta fold hydrolase n=1 Tax=Pseudomonas aeruginosa TaxID=287 RepID=UPI003FEFAD1C